MAPTREELLGRAQEIAPVLAKRALQTEQARKLLDESVNDIRDAQLLEILTPKMFGGHEMSIDTMADVVRILAEGCPSTAWVMGLYIGHNWRVAQFPEQAQREAFANQPYALGSGQAAPVLKVKRTDGGYVVSGRASWSSGVMHADWVTFGGLLIEDDKPPLSLSFLIPIGEVQVIDNWYVAGLKGSGSCDVAVDNVFVPEHRSIRNSDMVNGRGPGRALHPNPMYALPLIPFLIFETLPVMVGGLKGAAEEVLRLTRERKTTNTFVRVMDKQTAQMRIGRAFGIADQAKILLSHYAQRYMNGKQPENLEFMERGALKLQSALIADMCRAGINELMLGGGANGFRDESPLQRYFRDLNIIAVHSFMDIERATETYGRLKLGLKPEDPLL